MPRQLATVLSTLRLDLPEIRQLRVTHQVGDRMMLLGVMPWPSIT